MFTLLRRIWEATVKSTRSQLKYIIGNFIFKCMYTTLTQIKAFLNSRFSPMSINPTEPLTPANFLSSLPEINIEDVTCT